MKQIYFSVSLSISVIINPLRHSHRIIILLFKNLKFIEFE